MLKNWAGNLTYGSASLLEASSTAEVIALVKKYDTLKVLGTRHCFNGIADSQGHLLSLQGMNRIIGLETGSETVTVEAGVRYGELAVWLEERGYALHNLASLPHISVVGGCATGTHGSGTGNGSLPAAVRGIELVTAAGEQVSLMAQRDAADFAGAVVGLGALGVVTAITLAVEPSYSVSQTVYRELAVSELEDHFEDIMSAGYSVSLFTDWCGEHINEVWVKRRLDRPSIFSDGAAFFGAGAATHDLHPISHHSAENCTPQMGIPGPWHERLPHFKMGFTPSSGEELQSEYFVPRSESYAAIRAVAALAEKISPHLLISEIRCIAGDGLWMSPCYGRDSTAIHFTWKPDWPAVSGLLPLIEAALAPFSARPHWGKLFTMPRAGLEAVYERLPAFRALVGAYDPGGKFVNAFLAKYVL